MTKLSGLEISILAAVSRLEGTAYGVSIMDEVSKREGRDIAYGAIHLTLKRLQGTRLVTSQMGEPTPERGGRRKRYYKLTKEGRAALTQEHSLAERRFAGIEWLKPQISSG